MIHIVKKINFFLGMCMDDVDHTSYSDEAKMLLRFSINSHGVIFLNKLMDSIKLAEKVSGMKGDDDWEPSKDLIENVQEEWNERLKDVRKKKFKTENLFSDRQEDKKDDEAPTKDPRDNKRPQGGIPGA
jgi:hypothetical protein